MKRKLIRIIIAVIVMLPASSLFSAPAVIPQFSDGFVTPEQFKLPGDPNDTNCVNRAFASGMNVRFDRSYRVTSVTIAGGSRTIDFNGYKLIGINDGAPMDTVLRIAANRATLINVDVDANWMSYRTAVHWLALPDGPPAQFDRVYGMIIQGAEIGLLFGNYLNEKPANVGAESENFAEGLQFFNVQNCIQMNDINGSLFVTQSYLDCSDYTWRNQYISYNARNAWCIQIKSGAFHIASSEILKPRSAAGHVIEGDVYISDCRIEAGGSIFHTSDGNEIFVTGTSIQIPSLNPLTPIVDVTGAVGTLCYFSNSSLDAGAVAGYFFFPPVNTHVVVDNCLVQPSQSLSAPYIESTNVHFK